MTSGNLKRNLLIGFSASMIILIISSVASVFSIMNLLKASDMVDHTNEVIVTLGKIRGRVVDAETGQRGYLLTGRDEYLAPYTSARARVTEALAQADALTDDDLTQQSALVELRKLVDRRFEILDGRIQVKREGGELSVADLDRGLDIMNRIREQLQLMEDHERITLEARTASLNKFASFTPPLIISAALVALLITVLFYVKVRSDLEERMKLQTQLEDKDREISHRIEIIHGVADKIAQGNYEVRVSDQQSDALGSVGTALNRMATSLQHSFEVISDKEWLQSGLNQLNEQIMGDKTVEVLSKEVIDMLAAYTAAEVGSLYLLQGDRLYALSGYAMDPQKHRPEISIYEGLAGQAAASKKVLELRDIPESNIMISYAGGEIRPGHVVAVPILDGYIVKGVMEFGSLTRFSEREIEFFRNAAANIGIAISTAQNRKRLQELLNETQAQAEELKTQQTELENVNSELEAQAEKLQASEEELRVQQEELKQANQELEERSRLLEERNQLISERNIEIQHKADLLAQSTRYKSEFLANMSHELRTPLNSILLLSRLMAENTEKNLTSDQIDYARVIQNSGQGLLALIDEILDLSKIEAGKMQLEYQHTSVGEILSDMKSLFTPVATEKRIQFSAELHAGTPAHIETDKLRIEQILRNLLSNAIKFTSNGEVRLDVFCAKDDPGFIQFRVKDTGIGIPKDKHSHVFEAFQQADGSTRRKYGGTGLGLSISRELAKLLDGEISLESEPGKGSEFTVRVPVTRRNRKTDDASKSQDRVTSTDSVPPETEPVQIRSSNEFISTEIPANIPDDRDQIRQGDSCILIIEDDTNFAKALLDYTRKKNYKGIVAVRGDEGIQLARQFKPAGILLDIQLPVKSGWEVMDELKAHPETRHIPVHIMSSHQVKTESLMKGAVDFINKPVAFEQMHEVFRKIEYILTHHPKKVLIVEENAKHAKALAYFLETFDVNLDITSQLGGAIDALKNRDVDCVILDMGIPDQRSYDTLEEVKKTPGLENLPIIVFTGKSLSQKEELKIKQYADSIVVKTANSYKRILDEVSLFLHLMENRGTENGNAGRYRKLGALEEVLKNKTVLVADDDMRNIYSLTKALERYQMNVIPAIDGKDALLKLRDNKKVDIVLMDMMMPEMDGYETIQEIRKDMKLRHLPVIAVTAKAMMGDRAKCIEAGASDYITKPVDIDQLFSLLRVWLYEKV
jgi:signal transduction histidine kinase/DNA-binding response OmpR family regulator/CHASE3 domain sensor protein